MKNKEKIWLAVAVILLSSTLFTTYEYATLWHRYQEETSYEPIWITIKGYVTMKFTKDPIANAHILAFVGAPHYTERAYYFSVYDAYTDNSGYYSLEAPLYRGYVEVLLNVQDSYAEEGLVRLNQLDVVVDWGTHWWFNQNFTVWQLWSPP